MPRLIAVLVGAVCLSCSSPTPTAQSPEAAQEEVAPWETVSINGATYRRVAAKPTATQETVLISILIPVEISSNGTLTYSDIVMIGDRVYTADCATSSSSSTSSDDVGNTTATATTLTVPVPTSPDEGAFWRSSMYRLTAGDVDYFRLRVTGSRTISLAVVSGPSDSTTDTRGQLISSSGRVLSENDDTEGFEPNFFLWSQVSPGTYYVKVQGATSRVAGTYNLLVGTWTVAAGKPVASRELELRQMLD